jgi:hypothetical protein
MGLEPLLRAEGPWLYPFVATETAAWEFLVSLSARESPRMVARRVRGNKARTVPDWFDECSAALQFPYYFGENWNAFDECLTDLEWLPADAYVLLITNSQHLLEAETPEDKKTLFRILDRTGQEWGQRVSGEFSRPPKPFHVLFQCERAEEPSLCQVLDGSKVGWSPFVL